MSITFLGLDFNQLIVGGVLLGVAIVALWLAFHIADTKIRGYS